MSYSYSLVENAFKIEKLILEQDEKNNRYWNFKSLITNDSHNMDLSLKSSESFKRTKKWLENNAELFI
jgi:hypothetical protein